MSDFDDEIIYDAFDKFAEAAAPGIHVPGTASVRTTVRHRRVMRATALSVLGALIIAAPVATYAVTSHGRKAPPATVAPVASASTLPSATPSTPPSAVVPSTAPAGRPGAGGELTIAQLTAGTVTIPAWTDHHGDCPSGRLRLLGSAGTTLNVVKVAYTNLDGDAALETAALVRCPYGEASIEKIVGFDRNSAGQIVTLGSVAEGVIWSMSARTNGGVTVDISDYQACCDDPRPMEVHQTRSYAWSGSTFHQIAGPTTFISHTKPIPFTVTTSSAWGPLTHGNRTGTITVKITNKGSVTSEQILVMDDSGTSGAEALNAGMKLAPGLKPGASEQVRLTVTLFTGIPAAQCQVWVYELGSIGIGAEPTMTRYPLWS